MKNWFLRKWAYISNSISFLPALVSFSFGILSVVLIMLNDNPADKWLEERFKPKAQWTKE